MGSMSCSVSYSLCGRGHNAAPTKEMPKTKNLSKPINKDLEFFEPVVELKPSKLPENINLSLKN